ITTIEEVIGADKEKSKVKKIEKVKKENPGSAIYYVGDTVGDIYEGRKAGATTIGVTWGFHDKEKMESAEPDYLVDSLEKLKSFFS
ncbi:MAG: HAD hydrolase-like protein, partial [Candidatus Moraniibacteriota bacterium]